MEGIYKDPKTKAEIQIDSKDYETFANYEGTLFLMETVESLEDPEPEYELEAYEAYNDYSEVF